jgi:diaminopimelate decarboxylase
MAETLLSGKLTARDVAEAARVFGTPLYLYDESAILAKCHELRNIADPLGLELRYAMKANSSRALLQLITSQGFGIDASSLNEARRACAAGIPHGKIMLTTQEVPLGDDRTDLERMMRSGLRYNACSLRQLRLMADFAARERLPLSLRVHPGTGTGESSTRNTGDKYSCFGVHLTDLPAALGLARDKGLLLDGVHVHIGSGGDPQKWQENVEREIGFVERFPNAARVSFGGGLKEARMPRETPANVRELCVYAAQQVEEFHRRTGRKLVMEIEPGTWVVANAGFLVTTVIDLKQTGHDGFQFLVCDGGMEVNTRPLLYGSRHPFYVVSKDGRLLSSEFKLGALDPNRDLRVVVGRCCESGDSQSFYKGDDKEYHIEPRIMAEPAVGDFLVVGGCGAYCSSMSPFNYNSHTQAPEALLRVSGRLDAIRSPQTLEQVMANEHRLTE